MVLSFALAFAATYSVPPVGENHGAVGDFQPVYWDRLDASGRLVGGMVEMYAPPRPPRGDRIHAPVTTLSPSLLPANTANRVDLVVVGDGYQAGEIPAYANQVAGLAAYFFNKEPYQSYQPVFLVHRVDVVSVDSGIDNDPTQGVMKDTAMDMGFNCGGVGLCVDFVKAYQFANNAPAVDIVLALANSSTYTVGYGWFSGIATSSGTGTSLHELVQHEMGHALGRLADEYDYGDGATYSGPEIPRPNVSIRTSSEMASTMTKWFRWLGENDPAFDGLVSTFEGAHYHQFGINRPTDNSLMRNLFRPFNSPSAETVIFQIYAKVKPIDDSSSTSAIYDGTETLYVTPIPRQGPLFEIQWYLDGTAIAGATSSTLDLSTVSLPPCNSTVSVKVKDTTTMVRNEEKRDELMTETRFFNVRPAFSSYCTGAPNSTGSGASMLHAGSSGASANDLVLIVDACPAYKSGFFFWGQGETQAPLGNGFLCVGSSLKRFPIQQTDFAGYAERTVDLTALPGGDFVSPGDVRNVQFYYRDAAAGGAFSNVSNALSIRFCP